MNLNPAAQANVKGAVVALGLILCASLLSMGTDNMGASANVEQLTTSSLIKEAAQWSTVAQQDSNPLLALVHATYGAAYLNVARRLSSDKDIGRASNINVAEFSSALNSNQQAAMRTLLAQCPVVAPAGIAALQTGWLS